LDSDTSRSPPSEDDAWTVVFVFGCDGFGGPGARSRPRRSSRDRYSAACRHASDRYRADRPGSSWNSQKTAALKQYRTIRGSSDRHEPLRRRSPSSSSTSPASSSSEDGGEGGDDSSRLASLALTRAARPR
jgi:hypothetical protein